MHKLKSTTASNPRSLPSLVFGHSMRRDDQPSSTFRGACHPSAVHAQDVNWSLFLKALLGLLVFDALGFGRDFGGMHRFISEWKASSTKAERHSLDDVCLAVNYACAWYPKRALCLQRSAVTTCLLRSCGIDAMMVMGTQRLPFKAHAWTEVNGTAVNERREVRRYYTVWEEC
jgi:hypothetical protein